MRGWPLSSLRDFSLTRPVSSFTDDCLSILGLDFHNLSSSFPCPNLGAHTARVELSRGTCTTIRPRRIDSRTRVMGLPKVRLFLLVHVYVAHRERQEELQVEQARYALFLSSSTHLPTAATCRPGWASWLSFLLPDANSLTNGSFLQDRLGRRPRGDADGAEARTRYPCCA
jgi:hypothetical protein